MATPLTFHTFLVSATLAVATTACGITSTTKTEKSEEVEWNVTVNKVVEFSDTTLGISTNQDYTVADTAAVTPLLKELKPCGNITIAWTVPSSDGSIWLVAYESEPLLSENVAVSAGYPMPSYGDDLQVPFKFADAENWSRITRENIGERLAITVNGQLMNAPKVNNEITSGNCYVTIPSDLANHFLPKIDEQK